MRKFVFKLFWFQWPISAYFVVIGIVLFLSGELANYDRIFHRHNNDDILLGLAYSNPIDHLKLESVRARQPKVIALGTSRVMQIRGLYFQEPNRFYNSGGSIGKIEDFNAFLSKLGKNDLEVIVIGLDQYFFNENWDNMKGSPKKFENQTSFVSIVRNEQILEQFGLGNIDLKRISRSSHIGMTAKMYHQGFRKDGSYRYGKLLSNANRADENRFQSSLRQIKKGAKRFKYGQFIHEKAVHELGVFLENCNARNIHVVGFLPPYAPTVWKQMQLKGKQYAYINWLHERLMPIFEKHTFSVFDFSDLNSVGSTDEETIDGYHGSEIAYLRLMISMSKASSVLKKYTDLSRMQNALKNRYSGKEIQRESY